MSEEISTTPDPITENKTIEQEVEMPVKPGRFDWLADKIKSFFDKPRKSLEEFDPVTATRALVYDMIESNSPTGLNKWTSIHGMTRFIGLIVFGLVALASSFVNSGDMFTWEFAVISGIVIGLFAYWRNLNKELNQERVRTLMMGAISTVVDPYEKAVLTMAIFSINIDTEAAYVMLSSLSNSESRVTSVFQKIIAEDRERFIKEERMNDAYQKKRSAEQIKQDLFGNAGSTSQQAASPPPAPLEHPELLPEELRPDSAESSAETATNVS